MPDYKFKVIKDQIEILSIYEFLEKVPVIDETPETMLGRCLTKRYLCFGFYEGGKMIGTLVADNRFPELFVVAIYLKDNIKHFIDDWYELIKSFKYTSVKAHSKLPEEKFEKATRLERWYTVYRRKL
jgi:hypothetical protein